jgi:O-antigen ligase
MGDKFERFFIPALVGFAPIVFALTTWTAVQESPLQSLILLTALPVVVAELVVTVIALRAGLVSALRSNPPPPIAVAALAAWLAIVVINSLFRAPSRGIAILWGVHRIIHLGFGFSVAYLACRTFRIRDLVACYLLGFTVYVALFLLFVVTSWGVRTDWVFNLPAAIHIRHVGIYAAAMTGMSIGAMAGARGRVAQASLIAITTIGFALGAWSGSRGMLLSVGVATILAAILIPAMRRPRILGAAALCLVAGIIMIAWLPVPDQQMWGLGREVAATTQHEVTTGRVQIWKNVIHAIAHRPLLGYGPGQMPIVAPFYGMGQPHNFILQILLSSGVAGLICALILAFAFFRRALPALRDQGECLAAPFTGMMSLLALSMIDAAMFHVLPVSIFAACAGMIASAWLPFGEVAASAALDPVRDGRPGESEFI